MKIIKYGFLSIFFSVFLLNCGFHNDEYINTEAFNNIKSGFELPIDTNTLWCYWYWINDDISKDGITKDLIAMKEAGIGAALIGNINPAGIDGKVPMLSEEWWSHMVHAVTEGSRLGIDIGVFNCPGWSQSGGPWVDYTKAMRYLTYSETHIMGGKDISVILPQPKDEFQDTHVLAFKTTDKEKNDFIHRNVKVSSSAKLSNLSALIDGDTKSAITFPLKATKKLDFDFVLDNALTARHIAMTPHDAFKCRCKLYTVIDGDQTLIKTFLFDRSNLSVNVGPITHGALALSLPNAKAKHFKLVCDNFSGQRSKVGGFSEINISEAPVIDKYIEKQLGKMHSTPTPSWDTYVWEHQVQLAEASLCLSTDEILDVSSYMQTDGSLKWNAPAGEWTIIRMGMTPTGTRNSPSAPQGQGYEIDKMNSELAQFHFDNFVGQLLKRIPDQSKSAFKYVIADSYEMGSQNWTDDYEVRFKEKYNYDPIPFLPVLSGRIVESVEKSERFLWDLRRAIADDVAYEYVGGLRKASNKHQLKTWLENYGHWGFPSEFMMYGGQSDLIGGEFWNEGKLGNIECKASSSTAHVYGKPRTSAEAFTSGRKSYLRHPEMLKKRGDWCFTEGINHIVLHLYIQQPDDKRKPGMNAWFGTEFNRHNTWFSQADHYFDYLRRCQHMLQQGLYVADVCYFIGEDAPIMTGGRTPELPKGYSYDYINGEVILNRLSVENNCFVLPDGMSYKVMVLPPFTTMRPQVLEKLHQFVDQGGIILGQKPERSPSLQNYPQCDAIVSDLSTELWSGTYHDGKMRCQFGQGWVYDGYTLEEIFETIDLKQDVVVAPELPILWTHRTVPGMEVYFVSNQSDEVIDFRSSFRVDTSLKPQLWDAVTGNVRLLNDYSVDENGVSVHLKLEGSQSCFVVFVAPSISNENTSYSSNFPEVNTLQSIDGPFDVQFQNVDLGPSHIVKNETLTDWSLNSDDKIKYYSGSAIYRTTFSVDDLPQADDFFINLGEVGVMAEVKVNNKMVGGTWIAPYRLQITDALLQGENTLEIEVVNLWRNQLVKNKSLPENEKYTWLVNDDVRPKEKLQPSGLIGPVTIEYVK